MKKIYTLLFATFFVYSVNGQLCTKDGRFGNTPYFTDAQISSQLNVSFGNAPDYQGNNVNLKLDVYYPTLSVDTLKNRPLILMVHGGGLISGDKINYTRVCREFAKRGFVAVTVNYRLGVNCSADSIAEEKAKYRAQQDVHAAFRYVTNNAATLRVDTSWMFIGGGSAGSVAALGVVYLNQAEWNVFTPSLQPLLGNLNSSGNALTNTFSIKGVFNDWGAMFKASMQKSEMLPMVSFHGDADSTVIIDSSYGGGCVKVDKSYGSRAMHNLLLANGVCSDLSVKIGGGHGVFQDSVFGTPFRVGRAACFFRSLFCKNCTSFYQEDSVMATCNQVSDMSDPGTPTRIKVFPNPFTNNIHITYAEGEVYCTLSDQTGHVVYSGESIRSQDFSHLPLGVYFLKITSGQESSTVKLIKGNY